MRTTIYCDYPGCEYKTNKKNNLTVHMRKHTNERPFECTHCDQSFKTSSGLKTHILTHTGEKPHKCDQCSSSFTQKKSLDKHINSMHTGNEVYPCPYCKFESNSKQGTGIHIKNEHPGEKTLSEITKPYICDYKTCDKRFKKPQELKEHHSTHTGVRFLACDYPDCEYTTYNSGTLSWHKASHGEKNIICDVDGCNYKTYKQYNLNSHYQNIHTDIKPFICEYNECDYKCSLKRNLDRHILKHTGEKPYECQYCDYTANQQTTIIQHEAAHTGEMFYFCDFVFIDGRKCSYSVIKSGNLTTHKRTHTGERPFKCKELYCEYATTCGGNLKQHFESMHSERGIQRQKVQEEAIHKLFNKNKILFDRELYVDFKCVSETLVAPKRCAKIDFVVPRPEKNAMFLVEVDEQEHSAGNYMLSCEIKRMLDTYTSLTLNTKNKSVQHYIWIRYNPHKFEVDYESKNALQSSRRAALLKLINEYTPEKPMEIIYMYYSSRYNETNEMMEPCIFDYEEYNQEIKEFVKRCIV